MIQRIFLFIIVFTTCQCPHRVLGQLLERSVVSGSGDFFEANQGSLSWTLGEIISETYQQTPGYLTQGFHQPLLIRVTGLQESADGAVSVYPNPVRDFLMLEFDQQGEYTIELFNLQGQKLVSEQKEISLGAEPYRIDMSDFAVAFYVLRISNHVKNHSQNIRIEKY